MSKKVIFDVDGVLADFVAGFTKLAGCQPSWGERDKVAGGLWSFKDKIDPRVVEATWDALRADPGWWTTLPPLISEEVADQIDELQWDHEVLFVTARVSDHNVQRQTVQWLENQGIFEPSVVVSQKKGDIAAAFGADYHIDDKPENAACVHWMADRKPCKSYLLIYPHTTHAWVPAGVRRVTTVSEYLAAIKEGK